jgi:hypothetical protein
MITKYPVEVSDEEGIVDAVNYLLSGPSGLGQNFAGFSSYTPVKYLTGNFRIPYTQVNPASLYVTGIGVSNATQLDDRTIQYDFTGAPLGSAPFSLGQGLTITGITPSDYNSASLSAAGTPIRQIGVVECTDSYVIVRTRDPIVTPLGAYVSGGAIQFTAMDSYQSTDCDIRVTVNGGSDRVFISAQLDQLISYTIINSPAILTVYATINRYKGFTNDSPTNPDFLFDFDATIVEKAYPFTNLTTSGTLPLIETVFATVLDEPDPGLYRYILDVYFETDQSSPIYDIYVTQDELRVRSISAQVVKQ